ncbi:MAG: hypothetical protein AB7T10_00505 [bacterium]
MNKFMKRFLITFLALVLVMPIMARTAVENDGSRIMDQQLLNMNEMNMYISNFGIYGQNNWTGNSGGWWPRAYPSETYIFGAGVWVGALVDTGFTVDGTDTTWLTDTLVTCGYDANSGTTEFVPGDIDPNAPDRPSPWTNAWDIVYVSTEENGGQPWPIKTTTGADSVVSMQDSYCEYNDKDSAAHIAIENKPLEIEVMQTSYAWVGPLKEDIVFLKFDIRNDRTDGEDLKKCFIGLAADNDIGNEADDAANDLLGFIDTMTVDYNGVEDTLMQINVGYQFQLESEAGWHDTPGIIAYKYMQSPIATERVDLYHDESVVIEPGLDTIYTDSTRTVIDTILPRQIGMTTFNYFTIATDPSTKQARYVTLAGYDHTAFNPLDPDVSFRPFPVWGTGVAGFPGQTQDPSLAADKRFVMSSGPFTLFNDSTVTVIIAIIMSKNSDEMLDKMLIAQSIYDGGWLGPVAPGQVNFDLVGLDKKVQIYWDNAQELKADKYYTIVSDPGSPSYNPAYRDFDIEGYNIYRSKTGAVWELLAKYDKINEYTAIVMDSLIYVDNLTGAWETTYYYETLGTNTGIPYYFVDSNLVNGVTYYYTIKAYDFNYNDFDTITLEGKSPIILEGAGKTKAVVPRSLTSNYTAGTHNIEFISGNIDTNAIEMDIVQVLDTLVQDMAKDTFTLTFGLADSSILNTMLPAYNYVITNKAGTIVGEDKISMDTLWRFDEEANAQIKVISNIVENANAHSGFVFKINKYELDTLNWPTGANSALDVSIIEGTYNDSILRAEMAAAGRQFYHASKLYRLTWSEVVYSTLTVIGTDTFLPNDTNLTLTILDVDNNIEIPYNSRVIGDNWHFNYSTTATPAQCGQYLNTTSLATEKTGIYFSNMKLSFNYTDRPRAIVWTARPKDGDVWEIEITPNDTTLTYVYPPYNSVYKFTVTPSSFTELNDSILDNIKVVPNPYVVRSELDLDYNYRRILFTNLPKACTITIYTLAGELIKTIEHNTDYYVYSGTDSTLVYDNTNGYAEWDVLTQNDQIPAPGIYIYHINTPAGITKIGKFAIIK